ncbi:hypothetical protein ABIH81_13480 [Micromonospora sp. HUAS YX12]|uniref:Uncharacterized protein n=1 Tax=Micromonospora sp. HUAS YX12 TaxID=3156396 RepID=A0AAU7R8Z8_9ACTN
MRGRVAGLWHARGGPLASTVIVVALVIAAAFPELSLSVSTVFDLPPRGVGTPELVTIALASVLPAITTPRFDGRELTARRSARLGHLTYSTIMLAAPLAVLPVWHWVITIRHPDTQFPPLHGLIGNVVVFTSTGAILCLILGPLVATVATPSLFALLVVAQQALPESLLSKIFSTGRSWHTNYWITTTVALLALVLSWRLRAVPWPNRP